MTPEDFIGKFCHIKAWSPKKIISMTPHSRFSDTYYITFQDEPLPGFTNKVVFTYGTLDDLKIFIPGRISRFKIEET